MNKNSGIAEHTVMIKFVSTTQIQVSSQLFHLSVICLYGIIIQAKHGEASCNNEAGTFTDSGSPISISCPTVIRENMMK